MLKLYPFGNSLPIVVRNSKDQHYLFGRRLFDWEKTEYPILDLTGKRRGHHNHRQTHHGTLRVWADLTAGSGPAASPWLFEAKNRVRVAKATNAADIELTLLPTRKATIAGTTLARVFRTPRPVGRLC